MRYDTYDTTAVTVQHEIRAKAKSDLDAAETERVADLKQANDILQARPNHDKRRASHAIRYPTSTTVTISLALTLSLALALTHLTGQLLLL